MPANLGEAKNNKLYLIIFHFPFDKTIGVAFISFAVLVAKL